MYKAAVNFLRGQVLVHIESGCPERVVNLCAGAEVPFWDVQWLSPVELTLHTTRSLHLQGTAFPDALRPAGWL